MMRRQTGANLTSVYGRFPLSRQQRLEMDNMAAIDSQYSNSGQEPPNLPSLDLLTGSGEDYFKISIPLYEASIKGDWKSAKAIFDKKPELVKYSLTENGETALHIAVSLKRTEQTKEFVKNLVDFMNKEDMTLQNKDYNTALYLACAADNIKAVEIMVKKNKDLLTISGGGGQIMPLCAAVLFGSYDMVDYLYENSNKLQDDGWTQMNRDLLLEKCVEHDFFDVAIRIVKDWPELGCNWNVLGILAGKRDAFWEPEPDFWDRFTGKERRRFKLEAFDDPLIPSYYPPLLESIRSEALGGSGPGLVAPLAHRLSRPLPVFIFPFFGGNSQIKRKALQLLEIIWENIAKKPKYEIDEILKGPKDAVLMQVTKPYSGTVDQSLELIEQDAKLGFVKKDEAQKLEKVISESIAKIQVKTPAAKETHSSRVLFIAAERGNTRFIIEILRRYPDLIWSVNDDNQSIFHIAVKHRHADIYNLLHEIGAMKDMITSLIDDRGNNMLHLAAKCVNQTRLRDVPVGAVRMQRELLWFKEIEGIIHPSFREQKNEHGLTPDQLFLKEHKDLAAEGETWTKKLGGQCMVVAALIATMVFTAAYTVPGGYDQATGIPIFHWKSTFLIFVVADAISLFSSTASILFVFFFVFLESHPTIIDLVRLFDILIIGLGLLVLSLSSMIIAFCVSLFLLYHKGILWIPVLINILAWIPFSLCYERIFFFFFFFTDARRNLFKRKKQYFLYYQNPPV